MVEDNEKRNETVTAYHEAGHAVVGILTGRIPLLATIVPDGTGMVGKVEFEPNDGPPEAHRYQSDTPAKRAYARSRVLGELAGSAAHDIFEPGRVRDAADEHDAYWSRELIMKMVSWEDQDVYLARALNEAASLLQKHWAAVEALASALLEHKTMTRWQILVVVQEAM